ncbi:ornithine cyclodeaminase/alanine dehydrogenase-like protein (mu-crystallin family) [Kitasatospora sp. MAP12-15]|uniref:hypothetical protein n=1 Tax=unclassified Kitasatospora TaxID=2633591 RepID=UPI00247432B5|nr:hypothetical protein [Kitasatospora sp. MAP12-44]MDH6114550.1 ornithine cyclodeaminase/alanine dehydrogenase-like protein (mu-crystallin family) [Kitasatospora sp. MAP12-44]
MTEVERTDEVLRRHRREAEDAAGRLATAFELADISELPSLRPVFNATGIQQGAHVYLGGCSARVATELADALMVYARCVGKLVDGESSSLLRELLAQVGGTPALPGDGAIVIRREPT